MKVIEKTKGVQKVRKNVCHILIEAKMAFVFTNERDKANFEDIIYVKKSIFLEA